MKNLPTMLKTLRKECKQWKPPIVGTFAKGDNAVFKVLISTVLSLRTKDQTTEMASRRLFDIAQTPQAMLKLSAGHIEKTIYPVGFYRTKAKNILEICHTLIDKFNGIVPSEMEALLSLKGVGRKTANLVMTVGYNKLGICVDMHVHRISNRWGLVRTKSPDETEVVLRQILPRRFWIEYNELLVCYGQNMCMPVSPHCSRCAIRQYCPGLGVMTNR